MTHPLGRISRLTCSITWRMLTPRDASIPQFSVVFYKQEFKSLRFVSNAITRYTGEVFPQFTE